MVTRNFQRPVGRDPLVIQREQPWESIAPRTASSIRSLALLGPFCWKNLRVPAAASMGTTVSFCRRRSTAACRAARTLGAERDAIARSSSKLSSVVASSSPSSDRRSSCVPFSPCNTANRMGVSSPITWWPWTVEASRGPFGLVWPHPDPRRQIVPRENLVAPTSGGRAR